MNRKQSLPSKQIPTHESWAMSETDFLAIIGSHATIGVDNITNARSILSLTIQNYVHEKDMHPADFKKALSQLQKNMDESLMILSTYPEIMIAMTGIDAMQSKKTDGSFPNNNWKFDYPEILRDISKLSKSCADAPSASIIFQK